MSEISIKESSRGGNKNKRQKSVERWREGKKKREKERDRLRGLKNGRMGTGGRRSHERS